MSSRMESFVKGNCREMCPRGEREQREREGLIHPLEATDADFSRVTEQAFQQRSLRGRSQLSTASSQPPSARSTVGSKHRYGANADLVVKSYKRSAAGQEMSSPENLRPTAVLMRTVEHLLHKVFQSKRLPWCEVHSFISDRLRSVRQDATIQQINPTSYMTILESCAFFYAYSMYRQCKEHKNTCIDQHLNRKQLEESLHLCITLYDEFSQDSDTPSRLEMECIYMVLNIDSYAVLNRALKLKEYPCIESTLALCINYSLHNYIQVFKILPSIPIRAAAVFASYHLAPFRKRCLGIINAGFSCRNNFLPLCYLQKSLHINTEVQVKYLCEYYGLRVDCENRVACAKADFQASKATENIFTALDFIDTKLPDKLS